MDKIKKTNYKILNLNLNNKILYSKNTTVTYILSVYFSRSNTILSVIDCSGNTKFFYSAGNFSHRGRAKISRIRVLKDYYGIIVSKLKFLRETPIAIHFRNVGFKNFWFLRKLRKKFLVVSVKNFTLYPYNGCRKKKVRRKKVRRKKINKRKKWLSG